jgi:phosphoserine aminotransferase
MLNTPPTFPIYVTGLICKWLQEEVGGLRQMERRNQEKAQVVYEVLDRHSGFYRGHAERTARSLMNAVFFTPTPQLDETFVTEARKHLLSDLKGHRVLGGIRASIYNAMPLEGAQTLAQFMNDFAIRHG